MIACVFQYVLCAGLAACVDVAAPPNNAETTAEPTIADAMRLVRNGDETSREFLVGQLLHGAQVKIRDILWEASSEDRWLIPHLARLLKSDDRIVAWDATRCMWDNFPEDAKRISRNVLEEELEEHTARGLALELSRHGAANNRAKQLLNRDCRQLDPIRWGLMFLDGPSTSEETDVEGKKVFSASHIPQVAYICPNMHAAASGLKVGDLILEVDGRFRSGSDFYTAFHERDDLQLLVRRGKDTVTIELHLPAPATNGEQ